MHFLSAVDSYENFPVSLDVLKLVECFFQSLPLEFQVRLHFNGWQEGQRMGQRVMRQPNRRRSFWLKASSPAPAAMMAQVFGSGMVMRKSRVLPLFVPVLKAAFF